jgi:hypothetical protein
MKNDISTTQKKRNDMFALSLLRPPGGGFQCGEYYEGIKMDLSVAQDSMAEGDSPSHAITFYCPVARNDKDRKLLFQCREPSYGVLREGKEPVVHRRSDNTERMKEEDTGSFLFDDGFSLMGRTGFQVWPGSRIMIEALSYPRPSDGPVLKHWQKLVPNLKILELGAGVGCVGTSLAAAGAEVLMTDLPRIVSESILPNLERNKNALANKSPVQHIQNDDSQQPKDCPRWLQSTHAHAVGTGWAGTKCLDWTRPVNQQLSLEQYMEVDVIVACDCVWLISLLNALLSTIDDIFEAYRRGDRQPPKLLLSFQQRDSDMFTTFDHVMDELQKRRWNIQCLAWYPVVYESPEHDDDGTKELCILEICSIGVSSSE